MSKYYDKELPVTVHVTYGGRYSGRTYREVKRLKSKLEELKSNYSNVVTECKKLKSKAENYEELYNTLMTRCNKLMKYIDTLEEAKIITPLYANYIRDIVRSGF